MNVEQIIGWVLQVKEIIALLALLWMCWFLMSKHIPFLLMRSDERAEREAARHATNQAMMEQGIQKLSDTMGRGLEQLRSALVEISANRNACPMEPKARDREREAREH